MELLNTLSGWIIAAISLLSLVVAIFGARSAYRSARAVEQSADTAHRSAGAAESSAEVAREALQHAQEAEARRIRSTVALTAAHLESSYAEAEDLAEKLLQARRSAAGLFGNSANHKLLIAAAEKIPDELNALVDSIDRRDLSPDALRDLPVDDLDDLAARIRSVRGELEWRIDSMKRELRSLEADRQRELQRRDRLR